jgi:hypothetical protein
MRYEGNSENEGNPLQPRQHIGYRPDDQYNPDCDRNEPVQFAMTRLHL